uniref:Uncharacterized protein n=1 Tax=viral metagenome TaxID=1070528 RepID=A0A6M3JVF6_9ZZZZ
MDYTRDQLAEALRVGYRSIIREADEFRPLADHVLALIEREVRAQRERDAQKCRDRAEDARANAVQARDRGHFAAMQQWRDIANEAEACAEAIKKLKV